jgi:glycine oxidase
VHVARKSWDAVVAGAGVIGLSLALELRRRGLAVLLVERGAPGAEASHAAAGMLAWSDPHPQAAMRAFAEASFRSYPAFVHELEDESGEPVDLRLEGTLQLLAIGEHPPLFGCARVFPAGQVTALEPRLASDARACLLEEATVDPRALCVALERSARHRGCDLVTGSPVLAVLVENGRTCGVRTPRAEYAAPIVINCCGAWTPEIEDHAPAPRTPMRPVKGQMLSVVGRQVLRHTVRAPDVYLVPRSDGRLLIGATLEEAGFDKRVVPETIQRLHQAAANLIPEIGEMKILEAWAGLRPATPDGVPVLGATATPGYFVASGHFRDGILLAPITAKVVADLVTGAPPAFDLTPFAPQRFIR